LDRLLARFFTPYVRFTHLIGRPAVAGMNMAVRKSAFEKIGGFDLSFISCEDIDLFNRLMKVGRIKYCDATVFTSARRLIKWGYIRFLFFHITNVFRYNIERKAYAKYEAVR